MLRKSISFFVALTENRIFMLLFMSLSFILLYLRIFIGIDIVDAPYHLTSMLQVLQGKMPLMQIWDGHTGFFMMSPFIALYRKFVPDLEGLEFYYRLLSLTLAIIISLFNIHLLNKRIFNDRNIFLFFIPFIFTAPVMRLQYNTLTALLILTSANLIYTETSYFSAGIIAGLMCLSYPTCAVIAIFLFAYVTLKHGIKNGLIFSLGVVIIGSAFFIWIFSKGSISEFTAAINYALNSPHTANRGAITLKFLFKAIIIPVIFFFAKYISIFIAYCFNIYIINRFSSNDVRKKLLLLSFGMFVLISVAECFKLSQGRWYYISSLMVASLSFMAAMDKRRIKQQDIFYYVSIIFALVYVFTSDNKNFLVGLWVVSPVVAFVICLTLYEFCEKKADLISAASILSMILICAGLIHSYGYIYGEAGNVFGVGTFHSHALWKDSQVKKGIYKYLLTSEGKKNYLEQMQEFVSTNIHDDDKLCVITLEPSIYAYTNAEMYTPWTFDAQYLWAGFRSSKPFLDYFEFYNQYPAVIVATDRVNRDFYDNPDYEIHEFIRKHYMLSASKKIDDITIWIWRLRN